MVFVKIIDLKKRNKIIVVKELDRDYIMLKVRLIMEVKMIRLLSSLKMKEIEIV